MKLYKNGNFKEKLKKLETKVKGMQFEEMKETKNNEQNFDEELEEEALPTPPKISTKKQSSSFAAVSRAKRDILMVSLTIKSITFFSKMIEVDHLLQGSMFLSLASY